jgi:thymidylate kinase
MSAKIERANSLPSIYIEGTDLTGKDTVGEHVQQHYGFPNMHALFVDKKNPFEAQISQLTEAQKPFIGSLIARSLLHEIQTLSLSKPTLIVSSHALRAAAVQRGYNAPLADLFEDLAYYYPKFDSTILLTASLDAKKQRLAGRAGQQSAFDAQIHTNPDFVLLMDATIERLAKDVMGATVIDTSPLTIDGSKQASLDAIQTSLTGKTSKKVQRQIRSNLQYFLRELDNFDDFVRRKHKTDL